MNEMLTQLIGLFVAHGEVTALGKVILGILMGSILLAVILFFSILCIVMLFYPRRLKEISVANHRHAAAAGVLLIEELHYSWLRGVKSSFRVYNLPQTKEAPPELERPMKGIDNEKREGPMKGIDNDTRDSY